MKRFIILVSVLSIFLSACSSKEETATLSSYDIDNKEIVTSKDTELVSPNRTIIFQGKDKVSFNELDEKEQQVVKFIEEFFNVDKGETIEEFEARISKYYHEKLRDFYLEAVEVGETIYPTFSERRLSDIVMLPEYYEHVNDYVFPVYVTFQQNNEDRHVFLHIGLGKEGNDMKGSIGLDVDHEDVHRFVSDMTKKYELFDMSRDELFRR
ncbi:MAG: hypothetical protein ACK4M9_22520 [Anaerobacillus sp.]|uniref:hypothetical protein n=1 Tax=Anaerobacillus sp. TaxID=1872506 RepID=UPI00391BABF9